MPAVCDDSTLISWFFMGKFSQKCISGAKRMHIFGGDRKVSTRELEAIFSTFADAISGETVSFY